MFINIAVRIRQVFLSFFFHNVDKSELEGEILAAHPQIHVEFITQLRQLPGGNYLRIYSLILLRFQELRKAYRIFDLLTQESGNIWLPTFFSNYLIPSF